MLCDCVPAAQKLFSCDSSVRLPWDQTVHGRRSARLSHRLWPAFRGQGKGFTQKMDKKIRREARWRRNSDPSTAMIDLLCARMPLLHLAAFYLSLYQSRNKPHKDTHRHTHNINTKLIGNPQERQTERQTYCVCDRILKKNSVLEHLMCNVRQNTCHRMCSHGEAWRQTRRSRSDSLKSSSKAEF